MKDMLRAPPHSQSKRSSAQSRTSTLINIYLDGNITAEPEELSVQSAPGLLDMTSALDPVDGQTMLAIDEVLASDFPSSTLTSSELEGSTFLEGKSGTDDDSDADSVSSVYSGVSEETCLKNMFLEYDRISTTELTSSAETQGDELHVKEIEPSPRESLDEADSSVVKQLEISWSDSSDASVSDLPPATQDILLVCLMPVRNPAVAKNDPRISAICKVCEQALMRPQTGRADNRAWMLHSCVKSGAHYLHVGCLKDAKKVWENGDGAGKCQNCDAFKSIVRGIDVDEFEDRVERMKKRVFLL
ncbi:hypothetical protein NX059_005547 [Plenodomus lindquistii]|nr:hypothetical protein NX059_005547 [Plenodomus lindquistii]